MIDPRWWRVAVVLAPLVTCAPLSGCDNGPSRPPVPASDRRPGQPAGHAKPLDPEVVGPRLVRESFGPQLLFWRRTYSTRDGAPVRRSWATAARGRIVTLRLIRRRPSVNLTARWRIAVPLDRDLTPHQLRVLAGPRGIVPANQAARRMSSFPRVDRAHGPRAVSLALVARLQDVDPRGDRITVSIMAPGSVLDSVVTRRGRDLALLAGFTLLERTRLAPATSLVLAPGARLAAGTKPLTLSRLVATVARRGDALVVLSWRRAGRLSPAQLLARPVDGIELLVGPQ